MSWQYFKKGKLVKECNDIPETMEAAVIELRENDVDVSDCLVKPLTSKEEKAYFKAIKALKSIKAPEGFEMRLKHRIKQKKHINRYPSRLDKIKSWLRLWYMRIFR